MSIGYWLKCDLCGHTTDEWPEGARSFDGWARIDKPEGQIDYCPECVKKMLKAAQLGKNSETVTKE